MSTIVLTCFFFLLLSKYMRLLPSDIRESEIASVAELMSSGFSHTLKKKAESYRWLLVSAISLHVCEHTYAHSLTGMYTCIYHTHVKW